MQKNLDFFVNLIFNDLMEKQRLISEKFKNYSSYILSLRIFRDSLASFFIGAFVSFLLELGYYVKNHSFSENHLLPLILPVLLVLLVFVFQVAWMIYRFNTFLLFEKDGFSISRPRFMMSLFPSVKKVHFSNILEFIVCESSKELLVISVDQSCKRYSLALIFFDLDELENFINFLKINSNLKISTKRFKTPLKMMFNHKRFESP